METIIAYTDGGARGNPGPAGAGVYITDAHGAVLKEIAEPLGNATNNYAEYQAVYIALDALKQMFGKKTKEMKFEFRMDSELIQRQLSHVYQVKEPGLIPLFMAIHNLRVSSFPHVVFKHVRREQNTEADRLANAAMDAGN